MSLADKKPDDTSLEGDRKKRTIMSAVGYRFGAIGLSLVVGVTVAVVLMDVSGTRNLPFGIVFGVLSALLVICGFNCFENERVWRLTDWTYIAVVVGEWIVVAAILCIRMVYQDHYSLNLDAFVTAGILFSYIGSPIVFVIGLQSKNAKINRNVRFAVWAAGVFVALVVVYILLLIFAGLSPA